MQCPTSVSTHEAGKLAGRMGGRCHTPVDLSKCAEMHEIVGVRGEFAGLDCAKSAQEYDSIGVRGARGGGFCVY